MRAPEVIRSVAGCAALRGPGGPALSSVESLSLRDGRTLCVRSRGGREQGALVLLHGMLDSSEGWSELCQELNCPFVAFDIPGFGHSDARSRGAIADYARDIAEGLEILGVNRFTLVGHSLGGSIATALAELMPARVEALILLAPTGFGRIPMAEIASMPGLRVLVEAALPWTLSSRIMVSTGYMTWVTNGRWPSGEMVERVTSRAPFLVEGTREAVRAIAEAGKSRNAFHRRRVAYSGPVTAVWGDCDRLVPPSHQAGVRTAFPQARIHLWRGMAHHPISERLDDLVALIAEATAQHRPELRLGGARVAANTPQLADAA
jgi:pimeloyl-ACP methyl ester carboxylesterase